MKSRIDFNSGCIGLLRSFFNGAVALFIVLLLTWSTSVYADTLVYAYVANFSDNTVSVIDTSTNTIIRTIPVDGGPNGVALTPDNRFLYVVCYANGTVSVIDTSSGTVVGSPIRVGFEPYFIAITPNGAYAYVTNFGDGTVSVIDTNTNTVVGSPISIYDNNNYEPIGIAITPNGEFVYVTTNSSDDIYVISTSSNTVVDTFSIGELYSSYIAITPNGATGYVSNYYSNVYPIDLSNNSVGSPIFVGGVSDAYPIGIAITPNGQFAYVANDYADNASVINTGSNTVVGSPISLGIQPYLVAITPNGEFAYISNYISNYVSVINTTSNTVVDTIQVGTKPAGIAIGAVPPPPADSFAGKVLKSRFLTQTNRIHQLSWTASSSPAVVGYNLYRNGILIFTTGVSGPYTYNDNNRSSKVSDIYQLTTFNASHVESSYLSVVLQ